MDNFIKTLITSKMLGNFSYSNSKALEWLTKARSVCTPVGRGTYIAIGSALLNPMAFKSNKKYFATELSTTRRYLLLDVEA